jgi:hypothetical protein
MLPSSTHYDKRGMQELQYMIKMSSSSWTHKHVKMHKSKDEGG